MNDRGARHEYENNKTCRAALLRFPSQCTHCDYMDDEYAILYNAYRSVVHYILPNAVSGQRRCRQRRWLYCDTDSLRLGLHQSITNKLHVSWLNTSIFKEKTYVLIKFSSYW